MSLHKASPLTFRPAGLTDAIDGTNAAAGGMAILTNLVPNPSTANQFVCRPAAIQITNFGGNVPAEGGIGEFIIGESGIGVGGGGGGVTYGQVTALLVVGTKAIGFIPALTGPLAGHDVPFIYDIALGVFTNINNATAANTPLTQPTTGDWTPPHIESIGTRYVMTHPGYDGVGLFVGWIDVSSYSNSTAMGTTTNTSSQIVYTSDVITTYGYQVGYQIAGVGIPGGAFITNISSDGLTVTISAPATAGGTVATTVTGGTLAGPVYNAGNTAPFALPSRPNWVGQFNGRAYYAVANTAVWSDPLAPLQTTGDGGTAIPVLTLGDNTIVTALVGLPLTNQVSGGTVQSLIAFKGAGGYYQISGDATTTLVSSEVNGSVGTLAPNTICATPTGLAYIAPDGLRYLTLAGTCSEPIGADGDGVNVPFLNAVNPSRMCMAYNENTLRATVQNGNADGQPVAAYWYHLKRKIWTGPHNFPAALIQPYTAGAGNTFIIVATGIVSSLWQSEVIPSAGSTYIENGTSMAFAWQTDLLPDNARMCENLIVETALGVAIPESEVLTILAQDENSNSLNQITLTGGGAGASIWDAFDWGAAVWGSANAAFSQRWLEWTDPLVFKQMNLRITGQSLAGLVLGNLYLKYQPLGYLLPA